MIRSILVPKVLVIDGKIPAEAKTLARMFSLETKISETASEIEIVSEPRIRDVSYSKTYALGRIWSLNVKNEFLDMVDECFVSINGKNFFPKIQEKHAMKFRIRLTDSHQVNFVIYVNGEAFFSDSIFEV
jgi:hypothetical protein